MINAKDYGFLPENDGKTNAAILNSLLETHREIEVTLKGEYFLSDTVLLSSNTTLSFGEGIFIRREINEEETGYVFVNRGAYTRTYDENITINGLHIICDGVQSSPSVPNAKKVIPGLRGHISFFYIKNLVVRNFTTLDLPKEDFGIHVCTFENILIENVHIEGKKDAVHLGRGKGFVIKDGYFKTFDDPVALNAHDYATSNPQLGWIEDGVIENCYDYNDTSTVGYFCRILAGSWVDWYAGMVIQHSDTVVHNGRVYRALMSADGKTYISNTPPTHESGSAFLDGIRWVLVQNEVCYSCGCRNIQFKDIFIEKDRPVAISIHHDNDEYSRSVYPGSEAPVQENITFENVKVTGDTPIFLSCISPLKNFTLKNCELGDSIISLLELEQIPTYPEADFRLDGTKACLVETTPKRSYTFR